MANATQIKIQNLLTVLKAIQQQPGISRPELCRDCELTPSTVQSIIQSLERSAVIEYVGLAHSTGGRKAQCYRLRGDQYAIVSVNIRIDHLEVGILNLALDVLSHTNLRLDIGNLGPEAYVGLIAQEIHKQLSSGSLAGCNVLGIGVSIPGPTDFTAGTIFRLTRAPLWEGYPLAQRLQREINLPVWLDKDVYCGIRYLEYSGFLSNNQCIAYLSICEGIGTGLMIDGKIFRGGHGLAGEIGHVAVRRDGLPCHCGNTGCLELYCSDVGIVQQYNALRGSEFAAVEEIIALVNQEDETAKRIFSQAVSYLVETISAIIMNYDPTQIWINCQWLQQLRPLYARMLDVLYSKNVFTRKHTVDIRLLDTEQFYLRSAASLAASAQLFSIDSGLMEMVLHPK